MKKSFTLLMVFLLIAASFLVAFSQDLTTVKGEVIDLSCYAVSGATGTGHQACALTGLKVGEPAGILEDITGKIYIVVTNDQMASPSEKVIPYVAKKVEVTGTVNERGGVSTIDIKSIKEAEGLSSDMSGY